VINERARGVTVGEKMRAIRDFVRPRENNSPRLLRAGNASDRQSRVVISQRLGADQNRVDLRAEMIGVLS